MKYPEPTAYMVLVDHALLARLVATLELTERTLAVINDQLGNTRFYEAEAATYLGVQKKTMYHYRERGLPYEKMGHAISYRRKDLDAWRANSRTQTVAAI